MLHNKPAYLCIGFLVTDDQICYLPYVWYEYKLIVVYDEYIMCTWISYHIYV